MHPKHKFKALVRMVIANRSWLTLNDRSMRKSLQMEHKIKRGLVPQLSIEIKGLLMKENEWRTEDEKKLIYKNIGRIKCFRLYPELVKYMLAGCTYFVYYPANRTIVRQGHYAQALYYIIRGEVSVGVLSYDCITEKNVNTIIGTLVSGDTFGESSFLDDIPRNYTITSLTSVEFLILKREDFNNVIRETVKNLWDYTISSMNTLTFFDEWNMKTKREGCLLAKIINYTRNQTILGDGEGYQNFAYFILSGKCKIIEHLIVEKFYDKRGIQKYRLYTKDEEIESLDEVIFPTSMSSLNIFQESIRDTRIKTKSMQSAKFQSFHQTTGDVRYEPSKSSLQFINMAKSRSVYFASVLVSTEMSSDSNTEKDLSCILPDNTETIFMDVSTLDEKLCFGIGENMTRRRVIADGPVSCLLIPHYFLFHRCSNNKLNEIIFSLDKNIPTTQELFFEFIEQRKWKKYCDDLIKSLIKNKRPCNRIDNVPYSIRLKNRLYRVGRD